MHRSCRTFNSWGYFSHGEHHGLFSILLFTGFTSTLHRGSRTALNVCSTSKNHLNEKLLSLLLFSFLFESMKSSVHSGFNVNELRDLEEPQESHDVQQKPVQTPASGTQNSMHQLRLWTTSAKQICREGYWGPGGDQVAPLDQWRPTAFLGSISQPVQGSNSSPERGWHLWDQI